VEENGTDGGSVVCTRRQIRAGFTLLELMVVISIIALVMALLLPGLRRASEQAKQVACRKNLTDMWNAVIAYSVENRDRVPFIERIGPDVDPFDPEHPTLVGNVMGPYLSPGTFVCPAAVAGYPDTDPRSRSRWKLTYTFAAADLAGPADGYDEAKGAYTGELPDPAVLNAHYFDGRPLRMITMDRTLPEDRPSSSDSGQSGRGRTQGSGADKSKGSEATVVWATSVPLIADTLGERRPGDLEAGRPLYPHRGVVRRQKAVYRALALASDPRLVTGRRPGYFQLHAERDQKEIFLTRYTPDLSEDDR